LPGVSFNSSETGSTNHCQDVHNPANIKGVTGRSDVTPKDQLKTTRVPIDDSPCTIDGHSSYKPAYKLSTKPDSMPEPEPGSMSDNKPDTKPADEDHDLTLVIETWDKLPEAIRSAILALVRTAEQKPSDDEKQ
jgi:hypothetical protein